MKELGKAITNLKELLIKNPLIGTLRIIGIIGIILIIIFVIITLILKIKNKKNEPKF